MKDKSTRHNLKEHLCCINWRKDVSEKKKLNNENRSSSTEEMLQKIIVSVWKLTVGIIQSIIKAINKLCLLRLKSLYVIYVHEKGFLLPVIKYRNSGTQLSGGGTSRANHFMDFSVFLLWKEFCTLSREQSLHHNAHQF